MKFFDFIKSFVIHFFSKQTLGARALIIKDNRVLLIRHTYTKGWHTIGGGIDVNELPRQAVVREMREEVGVITNTQPKLFNVYYSNARKKDDYIIFYICNDFSETNYSCPIEIAEKKWFDLNDLPDDISPATLRRIEEYLGKKNIDEIW